MMKNKIKKIINLEKNDKIIFFLLFTTIGNIIIAFSKFFFSIITLSLWFGVNATFLFLLFLTRLFSIRDYQKIKKLTNKKNIEKICHQNYKMNGILLIFLGIMYGFVSVYMFNQNREIIIHPYLAYLVALFAFWSCGVAIYGIIKYKKKQDLILTAVKITNFANTLTSIVLTQVILLNTYGTNNNTSHLNGLTGFIVSIIILFMGFVMLKKEKYDTINKL